MITLIYLAESVVRQGDECEGVTDEDDSQTSFDVFQQPVDCRLNAVSYTDSTRQFMFCREVALTPQLTNR